MELLPLLLVLTTHITALTGFVALRRRAPTWVAAAVVGALLFNHAGLGESVKIMADTLASCLLCLGPSPLSRALDNRGFTWAPVSWWVRARSRSRLPSFSCRPRRPSCCCAGATTCARRGSGWRGRLRPPGHGMAGRQAPQLRHHRRSWASPVGPAAPPPWQHRPLRLGRHCAPRLARNRARGRRGRAGAGAPRRGLNPGHAPRRNGAAFLRADVRLLRRTLPRLRALAAALLDGQEPGPASRPDGAGGGRVAGRVVHRPDARVRRRPSGPYAHPLSATYLLVETRAESSGARVVLPGTARVERLTFGQMSASRMSVSSLSGAVPQDRLCPASGPSPRARTRQILAVRRTSDLASLYHTPTHLGTCSGQGQGRPARRPHTCEGTPRAGPSTPARDWVRHKVTIRGLPGRGGSSSRLDPRARR